MERKLIYGDYNSTPRENEKPKNLELKERGPWKNLRERSIRVGENLGERVKGSYDDLGEWRPETED